MSSQTFEILADADDVSVYGNNTNYNTARATSSAYSEVTARVGQRTLYYVYRQCLRFDTSAIEAGSAIDSVTLRLCAQADYTATDFDLEVVAAALTAPFASNVEANYDAILAEDTVLGEYNTASGWVPDTWYEIVLTPGAYVSDSGYTYLGLRSGRDKSATTPPGNEYVRIYDYYGDPTKAPELVVAWTPPAGGAIKPPRAALGVGW